MRIEMKLAQIKRTAGNLYRRNVKPIYVFVAFALCIFVFARIYQHLYEINPASFWFNEDIAKSQFELLQARQVLEQRAATAEIVRLNAKVAVVDATYSEFIKNRVTIDAKRLTARSDSGYVVQAREESGSGHGPAPILLDVSIFDPSGKVAVLHERLPWLDPPLTTAKVWITVLDDLRTEFQRQLLAQDDRIKSAAIALGPGRVWSYWDFLYFSAMTQTTVGYGDILPNATNVRGWVCAQVFVGYFLLVVIINLVLSRRSVL